MSKLALLGGTPIRTKDFPNRVSMGVEEKSAALRVLDSDVLSGFVGAAGKFFNGGKEVVDFEDFRKDEECTDSVGIYLRADESGRLHFRIKLGPQVQTLTRAMSSILCKGLDSLTPEELQEVPQDFVP